jgi:hypothetical protein
VGGIRTRIVELPLGSVAARCAIRFAEVHEMNRTQESVALLDTDELGRDETMESGITIQYYKEAIPAFAADELDKRYQSLYSALAEVKSRQDAPVSIDTYVLRENGRVKTILLSQRYRNSLRVLNEVMALDREAIERFVRYVFSEFPEIAIVSFHAIQTDVEKLAYPFQRFNTLEDVVLSLPSCEEEYLARLGKATRKTIKYYGNKLMRAHPSFRCRVYAKSEITREQVTAIVNMKAMRMTAKSKVPIVVAEDVDGIMGMIRNYGVVGIATIDDQICAGWIGYRVGSNDFMSMSAYDMRYEEFRLGTLCCYYAIRDCIARGGAECHFQWGQDEYKFRFLGVQRDLDDVVIYRSGKDVLANPATVLVGARKKYVRKMKLWLKRMRHVHGALTRIWPHKGEPAT